MQGGLRCVTSGQILRTKRSSGSCRCRLLKLTRRGDTVALSGDFGILPLGGHVAVVGGGEAGRVKQAGCLLFVPLTLTLVVIDGVRTITHAAGDVTRRIVRAMRRRVRPRGTITIGRDASSPRTTGRVSRPRRDNVTRRPTRRRDQRRVMFRIIRGVPRFPNNMEGVGRFVGDRLHCPIVTRRGKARNRIVTRFMVRTSNALSSLGVIGDMSPLLSTRTVHIVGRVPG